MSVGAVLLSVVQYCIRLTNADLRAWGGATSRLTALRLSYCRQLSDDGIGEVARNATALTELDVRSLQKLTVAPLLRFTHTAHWDSSSGPALRGLDVRGCTAISMQDARRLTAGLPRCRLLFATSM